MCWHKRPWIQTRINQPFPFGLMLLQPECCVAGDQLSHLLFPPSARRPDGPWPISSSTARPSRRWSGAPWIRACSPPRGRTTWWASGICPWSRVTWVPGWRGWRTCPLSSSSYTRASQRSRRSTGTRRCPVWWSPRRCQDLTCSGQYLCSMCVCERFLHRYE